MRHHVLLAFSLLALISMAGAAKADSKTIDAKPGLVELDAGSFTGDIAISWEARQPVALSYKTYHLDDNRRVCVFHAVQNTQYVIVSDVIDWDQRKRVKTSWIVNVGKPGPGPEPNPGPTPGPRPLGFAGDVYDAAIAVNRPAEAKRIAEVFNQVRTEVAARADMAPREAQERLNELLRAAKVDNSWMTFGVLINNYLNVNGKSRSKVLGIYELIIQGLEAAS